MTKQIKRLMPEPVRLGQKLLTTIDHAIFQLIDRQKRIPKGEERRVMGYTIPPWQRPLVWTTDQKISLIESIWKGVEIGTYTYNSKHASKFDNFLVDGQQRLSAIESYMSNEFLVFGYLYDDITENDQRSFGSRNFHCYRLETNDETYLREYYNLMNFGGTAHTDDQRAPT